MLAEKYNSFLYGNGLTKAILGLIKKHLSFPPIDSYLDFNIFFNEFIQAENHKRILRDFYNYFKIDSNSLKTHNNNRCYLIQRKDEFLKLGFESWASKYLSKKENKIPEEVIYYVYILYNYWYHIIYQNILSKPTVIKFLEKIAKLIKKKIILNKKIYTLNFDTILDEHLNPHHIHGVFALPLCEDKFEYIYLFGTNGLEKLSRLDKIRQLEKEKHQEKYDLDFLYNSDLDLEHLLIYGVSFGDTKFISEAFLEKYPKHENNYFIRSLDGHILLKLNILYKSQRVKKITISYHSQKDLENFKYIFSFTDFSSIVEYKHSSEIFDFENIVI